VDRFGVETKGFSNGKKRREKDLENQKLKVNKAELKKICWVGKELMGKKNRVTHRKRERIQKREKKKKTL